MFNYKWINMKTFRFILGYLIGFSVFVVLIPSLLIAASRNLDLLPNLNPIPNFYVRLFLALPIFGLGVLFAIWSNVFLFDKGLGGPLDAFNVAISARSTKLVVTGPYRYCRNPMVFGALCIYLSISIYVNSWLDLAAILSCVPLFVLFLKRSEEKRLIKDFGEEYLSYKSKTPMIIPRIKIRKKRRPNP
jgi:protein-S-isoprenylcysteine O-methyltransferase Ste14